MGVGWLALSRQGRVRPANGTDSATPLWRSRNVFSPCRNGYCDGRWLILRKQHHHRNLTGFPAVTVLQAGRAGTPARSTGRSTIGRLMTAEAKDSATASHQTRS